MDVEKKANSQGVGVIVGCGWVAVGASVLDAVAVGAAVDVTDTIADLAEVGVFWSR